MAPKEDLIPEVRNLLSLGKTQQEIAEQLDVSRSTIQRLMPLIKSEADLFEPLTLVAAVSMYDEGSPSVVLPLKSFRKMVDKSLPIIHPANWTRSSGEVKQYQQNVIIRLRPSSAYQQFMVQDFEKWYNYMEKYDLESDSFIRDYVTTAARYRDDSLRLLKDHIESKMHGWFGTNIENVGVGSITNVIRFYSLKLTDHLSEEEKSIFEKLERRRFSLDKELFFEIFAINPDPMNLTPHNFVNEALREPAREILTEIAGVPEDLVDHMIALKKYDVKELRLILEGGFKTEEDIEFAKAGDFRNMKEVRKARKLMCHNKKELQQVVEHGWADGDVMRNALSMGFKESEYDLYLLTVMRNDHITWSKASIAWARSSTHGTLKRLSDFSSIRALDFYDFLMDVQDPVYRTDRLMEEHNKLTSPGRKISSESKFEEFLEEFTQYVEVTAGGLTKILLNSDKSLMAQPRINHADFPSLKSLNTKLAKELKKALKQNNLNDATTDAYAFMKFQLEKHVGTENGEELKVVDEVASLLKLSKEQVSTLHQARLARNWVSHKESEQKIAPRWKYVEIMLAHAQRLSEIETS